MYMRKVKYKAIREAIEEKIKRIHWRTGSREGFLKKKAKAQTVGQNTDGLVTKILMCHVQQRIPEVKIKEGRQVERMCLQCLKLMQVNRLDKELLKTSKENIGNPVGKWSEALRRHVTQGKT